ncbi:MAG: c-type cytochrome [Nitrospinae bacterium]|nr:c-type cytochrome [Nitrospinota bacterium]
MRYCHGVVKVMGGNRGSAPLILVLVIGAALALYYVVKAMAPAIFGGAQPVEFSHKTHAGSMGISCLYCHYEARFSSQAYIPQAAACLNCHSSVAVQSPEVQKLGVYVAAGMEIKWRRLSTLPPTARFTHKPHVDNATSCQICHGKVEELENTISPGPFRMDACLKCHNGKAASAECLTCHDKNFAPAASATAKSGIKAKPAAKPLESEPQSGRTKTAPARLYNIYCANCHGATGLTASAPVGAKFNPPPPDLAGSAIRDEKEIVNRIMNGGTLMPSYQEELTEQEAADVAAYALSLMK